MIEITAPTRVPASRYTSPEFAALEAERMWPRVWQVACTLDHVREPVAGPFDMVVCEGAIARAPQAWTAILAVKGRLGVVERSGPVGQACLYVRAEGGVGRRDLFDSFSPLLAGFEPQHGFAF